MGDLGPVLGDPQTRWTSHARCPVKPQALGLLSSLSLRISLCAERLLTGQPRSLKLEVLLESWVFPNKVFLITWLS